MADRMANVWVEDGRCMCSTDSLLYMINYKLHHENLKYTDVGSASEPFEGNRIVDVIAPSGTSYEVSITCNQSGDSRWISFAERYIPECDESKNRTIRGTFLEVEGYESFCPLPGSATIDSEGCVIDVAIGGMTFMDLEDGIEVKFQDNEGNLYYR